MPKLSTTSLFLPESQITVELGLTYFESLEVQREALPLKAIDFAHPESLSPAQMDCLVTWQKKILSLSVKAWNSLVNGTVEPITPETMATLPGGDIQLIVTTMMSASPLTTKKKESTLDSSKASVADPLSPPPENSMMSRSS
jgi:hypothetical protein